MITNITFFKCLQQKGQSKECQSKESQSRNNKESESGSDSSESVDYWQMNLPEVRELLKSRNKKPKGSKPDLVEQLKFYDLFKHHIHVKGMGGYEMDNKPTINICETIACRDRINFRHNQGPMSGHEDVY